MFVDTTEVDFQRRQAELQQQAAAQQDDFLKQLFALFGKAINPSNAFRADKE